MYLKDKTAIITGSNRGIGKNILEKFSQNGADIYACCRNIDNNFKTFTEDLKKKHKNQINLIKLDLSDEDNIKKTANEIIFNDKIDILVNNAGTIDTALFQMTSLKKTKEIFDINFFSHTLLTQYVLKSMTKNKKGNIIYISSNSAIDGNEGRSAYIASKASMIAQAKVLSRELGDKNIRVNVIAPGLTNTEMMTENTKPETIEKVISNTSLKRIGEPEEIANVALFLASEMSSYITGQTIRVDGGI